MRQISTAGLAALSVVPVVSLCWLALVSKHVPEPYLDEVFHIPQAQAYWNGLWYSWDPKITTPPGLYISSYLPWIFASIFWPVASLTPFKLRLMNSMLLMAIPGYLYWRSSASKTIPSGQGGFERGHSAINISSFPLLFFFSALYYTDTLSAVTVIIAYISFLRRNANQGTKRNIGKSQVDAYLRGLSIFMLGLQAMLARQTNVFWVGIFLGSLQTLQTLEDLAIGVGTAIVGDKADASLDSEDGVRQLQDEPCIEVYISTALQLATRALSSLPQLLADLSPYLAILVAFGLFVVWNGGVVLGDKLNHIASLHLPQMLYIWPCMVFFSWPVLLPTVARMSWSTLPRLVVATPVMLVMTAVVHFNTIVHPFTLADNRHFVFYVFRILLRHPLIKYAVVPIYFVSAWLVIETLQHMPRVKKIENRDGLKISLPQARISFVLVWLATTTLSLVTAPLVEPRYFIIPWLIWRMNLHLETDLEDVGNGNHNQEGGVASLVRHRVWLTASQCLWVETIWYFLINLVTCYVFLYRGFEWAQEPGMTQRFLW